jgi:hypothetical protein
MRVELSLIDWQHDKIQPVTNLSRKLRQNVDLTIEREGNVLRIYAQSENGDTAELSLDVFQGALRLHVSSSNAPDLHADLPETIELLRFAPNPLMADVNAEHHVDTAA